MFMNLERILWCCTTSKQTVCVLCVSFFGSEYHLDLKLPFIGQVGVVHPHRDILLPCYHFITPVLSLA